MKKTDVCKRVCEEIRESGKVMDIGCGDGYIVNCMASKLNKKIIGLDISDEGFARAHAWCRKFVTCNLIECVKGDVQKMDFEDEHFDSICAVYSIHHAENQAKALVEIKRILRQRGKFVLVEYVIKKRRSKCRKFSKKDWLRLLENSGFAVKNIERPEDGDLLIIAERE